LLLKSDGGRKTVDGIDLGDAHLVKETAGVRGHGFEIAALGFGVKCAEGERRLARTGDAGEDDEGITRDLDVDVLEIVLASTAYANEPVLDGSSRIWSL
jgi:hypothetical protein